MRKNLAKLFGLTALLALLIACTPATTQPLEPGVDNNSNAVEEDAAQEDLETPTPEPTEVEVEAEDSAASEEEDMTVDDETRAEIRATLASTPRAVPVEGGPLDDAPEEAPPPLIVGEVPQEILDNLMTDMTTRTEADLNEFTVRRAEQVVFPDGSLGCPEPGQVYTMALVNGYVVEIEVDGEVYDYRITDKGFFKLCESKKRFVPVEGTPNS
ncbi:MAG: hypothetical protein QNJ45_06960 [Ardenticatenaceae bacterium]|nr:hypothetical protein [Ardenticatenaceae bacterium]